MPEFVSDPLGGFFCSIFHDKIFKATFRTIEKEHSLTSIMGPLQGAGSL